jgi:CheY-like chemotaxis protein
MAEDLQGCHILLVEDEYFIADAMQRSLEDIGMHVVGPAASVVDALALLDSQLVNGAILDVNLDDEGVFPVAEALTERRIPFVFATGYNASDLPTSWQHVTRFEKPADAWLIARTLFG